MSFRTAASARLGLGRRKPLGSIWFCVSLVVGVAALGAFLTAQSAVATTSTASAVPASFAAGVQNTSPNAYFDGVSCNSPGNCTAAGNFEDPAGNTEAVTETSTAGVWANAVPASFAAGVQNTSPTAYVNGVSCGSPGNCTASGTFRDAAGNYQAFTETSTAGVWANGVPATFAAGVQNTSPNANFDAVLCGSPGNCTAAGQFTDAAGNDEAFTETSTAGVWANAVPATFAAGVQETSPNASFSAVSCVSPGSCTAAGQFNDAAGNTEAVTETSTAGVWANAVPATFAAGVQDTSPSAYFNAVSCGSPGSCTAAGQFTDAAGNDEAVTETSTGGVWANAVPASFAAGVQNTSPAAYFNGVSCGSAGNCTAAGQFQDAAGNYEAFTEASNAGVSANGVPASFAAGVQNTAPNTLFNAISCASPGDCTAAGQFTDAAGHREAFTETSSGGVWANGVPTSFDAGVQNTTPNAELSAVSCGSPGNCTAAGAFTASGDNTEAFTDTITTPPTVTAPAPNATPTTTTGSTTTGTTTTTTTGGLPSNRFTLDGYTHTRNGTVQLTLTLPGAGTVRTLGTHSDPPTANTATVLPEPGHHRFAWSTRTTTAATKAGTIHITLHPNTAGTRMMRYARNQGWALHIRVWTTYTPTGGAPRDRRPITIRVLAPTKNP
jgi:hypothetical protein